VDPSGHAIKKKTIFFLTCEVLFIKIHAVDTFFRESTYNIENTSSIESHSNSRITISILLIVIEISTNSSKSISINP
jgi:hypothetical protein